MRKGARQLGLQGHARGRARAALCARLMQVRPNGTQLECKKAPKVGALVCTQMQLLSRPPPPAGAAQAAMVVSGGGGGGGRRAVWCRLVTGQGLFF